MWFRRTKPLIGIDIGSHAIKLVRFARTGNSYQLLDLALLPIPPDTVVDGVIGDLPGVQGMLRRLITLENITDKDVALALSGHSVIVKKVQMVQDVRGRIGQCHALRSRAAYPLRRVRCQHGLSDPQLLTIRTRTEVGRWRCCWPPPKRAAWMS